MTATYKSEPLPEDDELENLFNSFDKQLREVQKKFSDLEKEIAEIRKKRESSVDQDVIDEKSQ